jgi:hypothetical protein
MSDIPRDRIWVQRKAYPYAHAARKRRYGICDVGGVTKNFFYPIPNSIK